MAKTRNQQDVYKKNDDTDTKMLYSFFKHYIGVVVPQSIAKDEEGFPLKIFIFLFLAFNFYFVFSFCWGPGLIPLNKLFCFLINSPRYRFSFQNGFRNSQMFMLMKKP